MKNVIFINAPEKAKSSYDMGLSLWAILKHSSQFNYVYTIPLDYKSLLDTIEEYDSNIILQNHLTLCPDWMHDGIIKENRLREIKQFSFSTHGMFFSRPGFDAYLIPDTRIPRNGNVWPMGRPLPRATTKSIPPHERPVIGTAGNLLPHKQFPATVARIISEFDSALIRLSICRCEMSLYELNDADDCRKLVEQCGKDILLSIENAILPIHLLVDWLAENDLNVYLYAPGTGGPAPAISPDVALAARRPIAVTKLASGLGLFHDCKPSVCVEDSSLKTIMANGIAPLAPIYERFSDKRILEDVEMCIKQTLNL